MIKTVVLDVDGVMTDGRKHYDKNGQVISKIFCDKDWTAIKRFRAIGVNIVCITGDSFNAPILENRNIHTIVCRKDGVHTDKLHYLEAICQTYGCTPDEICVVGDDIFDLNLMLRVKHRYCLIDSPAVVKQYCDVLGCRGGENAIMILFERLEAFEHVPKIEWNEVINTMYELDVAEKF